jgi:hypothetical protein
MSVGKATESIFYNDKLPKNTPEEIKNLLKDKKSSAVKDAPEGSKLEKTLSSFYSYYLNGNVHKQVQEMYLENNLNAIINSNA